MEARSPTLALNHLTGFNHRAFTGSLAFVGFAGMCTVRALSELLFGEPRIGDLNSSDKRGDFAFRIVATVDHHAEGSRRAIFCICEDGLAKRSRQDEFRRNIADLQS